MGAENEAVSSNNALAHGVDIVDIVEFAKLVDGPAKDFLDRYFNDCEIEAAGRGAGRVEKLASRFAIKEAVLKALRTGWGDGIAFTDVEVVTDSGGAPAVILHRNLLNAAVRLGIKSWLVSASHTNGIAFASVIALS